MLGFSGCEKKREAMAPAAPQEVEYAQRQWPFMKMKKGLENKG